MPTSIYRFEDGFVVGLFFADAVETLPEADYIRAAWLEIKVPGGEVFRLAPLDCGI